MALIGKIRQNFWFVLILLGLALAAFLIMDTSLSGNGGGGAAPAFIGSVNGTKINYNDFTMTEQAYFGGSQADSYSKKTTIWNYYVEKELLREEADALGLNVSYDELMDLQFGANPSPIITQNQWKPADLQGIKTSLTNGEAINPSLEAYWIEQEKQIMNEAIKAKLNGIISKSIYTPSWLAEESFASENTKVDFKYVKIPYDQIDGAGIEATDADIKNYVSERKSQFEQKEETRIAEYAVFDVMPSTADSSYWLDKANEMKTNFLNAANDSLFVTGNKGYYSHIYNKLDQVSEANRGGIAALNPGEMYGPFQEAGSYVVIKMIDKKIVPDTVQASHILRSADPNNPTAMAQAEAFIDSIRGVYKSGKVSFDTLAVRHSNDPGSGAKGGDLGKFTQETMVPEFAKACFGYGKEGGLYTVKTQFGVHLIKVVDQIYNDQNVKYNFASLSQSIIPTQETQDTRYDEVTEIVSQNREAADLSTALEAYPNVSLETSAPLKINDYAFATLGSGNTPRDIIKWLFNPSTEVGDVSDDVFRFSDQIQYYDNKYVVVTLKSIVPAGMPTADILRNKVEAAVINQKKGEKLQSSLSVTSLDAVASQYNTTVETATDVTAAASFVPGVGNEPEVIGTAFDLAAQSVSKPIVGESGVFVIEPIRKMDAGAPTNIPFLKSSVSTATRSQVSFKIIENMKKRADISDSRAKFF